MIDFIVFIVVIINVVSFLLYGIDKHKAKKNHWRISEKTLLLWGAFAPFGAVAGMKFFHHKTQKAKFDIILTLAVVLHILLYGTILSMMMK